MSRQTSKNPGRGRATPHKANAMQRAFQGGFGTAAAMARKNAYTKEALRAMKEDRECMDDIINGIAH